MHWEIKKLPLPINYRIVQEQILYEKDMGIL